jgi:ketosteroid isomerase-like protein
MSQFALLRYYELLDAGDMDAAFAQMAPDVTFVISIAGVVRRGTDRSGIAGYLAARGDVVRRHDILRTSKDGDVEFVYGAIVEDGIRATGQFLAAARITEAGMIGAYQVMFEKEAVLLPSAEISR